MQKYFISYILSPIRMNNLYANVKVKKSKGQAEIAAEIPWEVLQGFYEARLEELKDGFEAPGFRKGKVPMDIFKAHVHDHAILEDAVGEALEEAYPALIEAEKLDVVGRPQVSITKLAMKNPAEFKALVGLVPEVKLPNYKKIAKEVFGDIKAPEVADTEVEEVINTLLKMRAPAKKEGELEEPKLPELTDEFVKTLGAFENATDFRGKLKKNMEEEKLVGARRGAREEMGKKLVEKSSLYLPELLIADELETMETQLLADLGQANLSFEDYLKQSGKTKEDLAKEHRGYVERQTAMRFILEAIAKEEDIKPDEKEVENEAKIMAERYPDLDRGRIRSYIERLLKNEKVLQFLENQNEKTA